SPPSARWTALRRDARSASSGRARRRRASRASTRPLPRATAGGGETGADTGPPTRPSPRGTRGSGDTRRAPARSAAPRSAPPTAGRTPREQEGAGDPPGRALRSRCTEGATGARPPAPAGSRAASPDGPRELPARRRPTRRTPPSPSTRQTPESMSESSRAAPFPSSDFQQETDGWTPHGAVSSGAAPSRPARPSRRSQLGIASGVPRASAAPGSGLGVARSATPPFGEERKIHLVDGVEHLDDGPLDDLILQRGNSERPLPPVRLRDVHPPRGPRPVR